MPDGDLLRAFRFRVSLTPSSPSAPPASAGLFASASLGPGGFSAGASASAGFGFGGGAGLGDGGFSECSGLDLEMDVQELQVGGHNDSTVRRIGRVKLQPLVLKRGMLYSRGGGVNLELWQWLQDVVGGVRPARRYDGVVEVMSVADEVAARWVFTRGLPAKLSGPALNARTGEVAIEELHIVHESLRLVAP